VGAYPEPYDDRLFHDPERPIAQPNSHGVDIAFLIHFLKSQTGVAWVAAEQAVGALRLAAYVVRK